MINAPCYKCELIEWCSRKGCVVLNDDSRRTYLELRRRSQETNDWIDEFEREVLALSSQDGA